MAKKHQEEEHGESAPLWIISFADLVTLMLSFFVILAASGSKVVDQNPDFAEFVSAMKAAFGNAPSAAEAAIDPGTDFEALVRRLTALAKNYKPPAKGDTKDEGIPGRHFRVRRLSDGMEITIGGPVFFEPFSATLSDEGQQQLMHILDICKGHRNIIEIRGHAGEDPYPSDWTYADSLALSYARAGHVAQILTKNGIDPRAIRLVAVGPAEPVARQAYDLASRAKNRRVEIIVRESLIDDYLGQIPAPPLPDSRPAE